MTEHEQLRAMATYDERRSWLDSKLRYISADLMSVKIDGHLVAVGRDAEIDDIAARFLMFIAREFPIRPKRRLRGMG